LTFFGDRKLTDNFCHGKLCIIIDGDVMRKKFLSFVLILIVLIFPFSVSALSKEEMQSVSYQKVFEFVRPSGYASFQGMIITDQYIVLAAIKDDSSNTALFVFDKGTYQLAELENNPIIDYNFGHANDMAYNSETHEIYIINNNIIHVLDDQSFQEKDSITLSKGFVGIAYDDSTQQFFFRDASSAYICSDAMGILKSFPTPTNLTRQAISVFDQHYYYTAYENGAVNSYQSVYDGVLEAGSNLIYVYDFDGNLVNTLYLSPGYGELEAMEFDDGIPYLLFNDFSNSKAVIYRPSFDEEVSLSFSVEVDNDEKIDFDDLTAILSSNDVEVSSTTLQDGKYSFDAITFDRIGDFSYQVSQVLDHQDKIVYDESVIQVLARVFYNPIYDKLDGLVEYYPVSQFKNKDRSQYYCASLDNVFYDNSGFETTKEQHILECGEIENPKTGDGISWLIMITGIILAMLMMSYRKTKFYKLR